MLYQLYILGLVGTFAFSIFGAYQGIKKGFDLFGIFVSSFLTSIGGGTIVSIILNEAPVYFHDDNYILTILAGTLFAIIFYNFIPKLTKYILVIDAVGLSTFALVGAERATESGFGLTATIFFATVMAVGGGLIRDIAIGEVPQIFFRDFYAYPAIILAVIYYFSGSYRQSPLIIYSILILAFVIRILAIYFKVNIWRPWNKKYEQNKKT
ncbi:MAG: TRIC cation channel family protein [Candidatus Vogelbacteria bacterium]|nr:TRIC cation channel family protein [Candidatus Vogelbacteria bacterium]